MSRRSDTDCRYFRLAVRAAASADPDLEITEAGWRALESEGHVRKAAIELTEWIVLMDQATVRC